MIGCQQFLSRPLALTRNAERLKYKSVNIPHTSCVNISTSSPATGLARRHSEKQFCPRVIPSWSHHLRDSISSKLDHVRRYLLAAKAAERRACGPGQICEHERVRKAAFKCAFFPFKVQPSDVLFTRSYDNLLKTDLEVALEEHLRANSTKYAQDPKLEPYYRRQAVLSPVKRETGSTLITSENENKRPQRARRQTRGAREDTDAP